VIQNPYTEDEIHACVYVINMVHTITYMFLVSHNFSNSRKIVEARQKGGLHIFKEIERRYIGLVEM
jgi:hypothetical protein